MRGKRQEDHSRVAHKGITPADAGKTLYLSLRVWFPQDHPRGCGENTGDFAFISAEKGSPPRMRGKPHTAQTISVQARITPADAGKTKTHTVKVTVDDRITPADAGKTGVISIICPLTQDHPRGCGENANVAESIRLYGGSPPRMRGKLCSIPRKGRSARDHPRGCGENLFGGI